METLRLMVVRPAHHRQVLLLLDTQPARHLAVIDATYTAKTGIYVQPVSLTNYVLTNCSCEVPSLRGGFVFFEKICKLLLGPSLEKLEISLRLLSSCPLTSEKSPFLHTAVCPRRQREGVQEQQDQQQVVFYYCTTAVRAIPLEISTWKFRNLGTQNRVPIADWSTWLVEPLWLDWADLTTPGFPTPNTHDQNSMAASVQRRCGGMIGMVLIVIVISVHLIWVESTDNSFMVRNRECPQAAARLSNTALPSFLTEWSESCASYDFLSCPTVWLAI